MKKNYVAPRTMPVNVVTENGFAVWLSKVTGVGTSKDGGTTYLTIGDGGVDEDVTPTAKRGFWDV